MATSTTYYSDLEEIEDSRIVTILEWIIKLDNARGMNLKLGLENEYESSPADDDDNNDLKYYGTIVFEF